MTTPERLHLLATSAPLFEAWTDPFSQADLSELVRTDLGHPDALDLPVPRPHGSSLALAPNNLLHVLSGNTPHAALQSLLRGLVLGARNHLKLPSSGLPDCEEVVAALPPALAELVTLSTELPADWQSRFDTVVVFGSDQTTAWFAANTPPHLRLVTHGTGLSIALVTGDPESAAREAAVDISRFDQRGCLSVHDVYVAAEAGLSAREFAARLAAEMDSFQTLHPRAALDPSAAGAITTLRETARFVAASNPEQVALWESPGSTAWTVLYESEPLLKISPLNRVVYVKPWPADHLPESLGSNLRHLSTLALHPFDPARAASLAGLGATRLCPLGQTQNPSLFWHQDGLPPLASLVTWVDIG